MKKASFILFLLFFSIAASAQTINQILPKLEKSLGGYDHTNRDELIQMAKDPEGNLLLLGFVEGDSIFADVVLQKITPEGTLLWDYRFDSDNSNNYDVPLKMVLDTKGDATVLGRSGGMVSFFMPQRSNGFLFKVSNSGDLLWQVGFDTLLTKHDAGFNYDGFMDSDGNFLVSYSAYTDFGERPTYFMKFDPNGKLLQFFKKYEIVQKLGGGQAARGSAIDSSGNFVFVQMDETFLSPNIRK